MEFQLGTITKGLEAQQLQLLEFQQSALLSWFRRQGWAGAGKRSVMANVPAKLLTVKHHSPIYWVHFCLATFHCTRTDAIPQPIPIPACSGRKTRCGKPPSLSRE